MREIKNVPVKNIGPVEGTDHHYIPSYITDDLQTYYKDGIEYVGSPREAAHYRNKRNLQRKHERKRTRNTRPGAVLEILELRRAA